MLQTETVNCRGIHVDLKGFAYHSISSGDGAEVVTQDYAVHVQNVWGTVAMTKPVPCSSKDIFFGPPWSPYEGVLYVPVAEGQNALVVQVMDGKDGNKVLGEVLLSIQQYIGRQDSVLLTRKGKAEGATLSFGLKWEDSHSVMHPTEQSSKTLRLQINTISDIQIGHNFFKYSTTHTRAFGVSSGDLSLPASQLPSPSCCVLPHGA